MNKVVVTGATSMLGIAFCFECVNNGTQVIALSRSASERNHLLPISPLIQSIECPLESLAAFESRDAYGADAWYHFAWAATSRSGRDNPLLQAKNIQFTLDALQAASRMGGKKFLGAGSQAEYGRKVGRVLDSSAVLPETAYGTAKYAAGNFVRQLSGELGMEGIWMRIFSVYGPNDQPSTLISYCISELLQRRVPQLTACEQMWDYLYCGDAARAFYLLGKYGVHGKVYNIGSGQSCQLKEFVQAIRNCIDPELPLDIGALPYAAKQVMHLCAGIDNLKKDTGFCPAYSFEDGIKETIEAMKVTLAESGVSLH